MKCNNYIVLSNPSILYKWVMYVDTSDFLADSLFNQYNVRVKFGKHFDNKDYKEYNIITAKVRKPDIGQFKRCMEQLEKKMLLCGHTDYTDSCTEIMNKILGGN